MTPPAATSGRRAVLERLWRGIAQVRPEGRALIAVDGVDGAGKTRLAAELAAIAAHEGARPAVTVSIDGFHRPRAERLAAGTGPDGFYRASYRYDAFRRSVVEPLRAGLPIIPAVWDVARDAPVDPEPVQVPPGGIVLVDGIFLQRPELRDVWDAVVWVEVPFAVSVPRGNARFPGMREADPEAPSNRRYVQGQRLYLAEAAPAERARWILDNTDLTRPRLRDQRGGASGAEHTDAPAVEPS
ncbi:uridine kinase [Brachybacterium phenoliresistens]|uniref:Uridine kinase n=1 Tax=Brachybacterium phenoliresistens TaxID=396014 RepID=Z9JMQ0_9MICO|nr:uridine kinase [Brachybacterium phenoliresistens]EWS79710.1 uridine kinase [Brachybacterium phenoliresistens]